MTADPLLLKQPALYSSDAPYANSGGECAPTVRLTSKLQLLNASQRLIIASSLPEKKLRAFGSWVDMSEPSGTELPDWKGSDG